MYARPQVTGQGLPGTRLTLPTLTANTAALLSVAASTSRNGMFHLACDQEASFGASYKEHVPCRETPTGQKGLA